ncbi:MAG: hypothetical protein QXQ70_09385 [Candidatus Caldarchaeum sp.]
MKAVNTSNSTPLTSPTIAKDVRNTYFENYNIDILIPKCRLAVEVDGLQHYRQSLGKRPH